MSNIVLIIRVWKHRSDLVHQTAGHDKPCILTLNISLVQKEVQVSVTCIAIVPEINIGHKGNRGMWSLTCLKEFHSPSSPSCSRRSSVLSPRWLGSVAFQEGDLCWHILTLIFIKNQKMINSLPKCPVAVSRDLQQIDSLRVGFKEQLPHWQYISGASPSLSSGSGSLLTSSKKSFSTAGLRSLIWGSSLMVDKTLHIEL